jgi:hypothetical protein
MDMEKKNKKDKDNGSVLAATTGIIAGGVATSGPALSAAGIAGGGLTAYASGLGITIAAVGCETAAIGTLAVIAAGPILGGIIAYSGYKAIKGMIRKDKKPD